jgi:hypothetical protein
MDAGLLGEHVLQTLADAWARLLLPPCPGLSTERSGQSSPFTSKHTASQQHYGLVIPLGASIWIAALESTHLARSVSVPSHILSSIGLDPSISLVAYREEPYDSEDFTKLPDNSKLLSLPQDVLYINFNDPIDINNCLLGKKGDIVKISCNEAGRVDGIIAWFSLRLDEDILLSSAPGHGSCWEQAIFPLSHAVDVQAGQELEISISCLAGKLSITVNQSSENELPLSDASIFFLNNEPWITALTEVASDLKEKRGLEVLDLSPFPLVGLQLLNQGSASKISCLLRSEVDQKVVKLAAHETNVEFLLEDDIDKLTKQFDVIILHPISKSGELEQSSILHIPMLR